MNIPFEDADAFLDHLTELFASRDGKLEVEGRLSNATHMLQTAAAAEAAGAEPCLIAASLLHDIGHWLHGETTNARCVDGSHESIGAAWLEAYFDSDVTHPVALHVAAKRYLCAREPDYFANLSRGSVASLAVQGGPMSDVEAAAFEADPAHGHAVALRRWDEYGKIPGLQVPGIEHYRPLLRDLMRVQDRRHGRASRRKSTCRC